MRWWSIAVTALALSCCGPGGEPQGGSGQTAEPAQDKGVDRSQQGKDAPDVAFKNPEGEDITLEEFAGKPVLVNLWATWCAPCVRELPALDRLAKSADSKGLQVIAVSQDSGPHPSVVAFLRKLKIANLGAFQDSTMALSGAAGAQILPTTIFYDASGREVWRYVGDFDWSGPEATRLLSEARANAG